MTARMLVVLVGVTVGSCVDPLTPTAERSVGPLPEDIAYPDDNPTSPEKVALGRMLFWDPVLSGDRDVACATCHHPDFAYADGRALSIGVGGTGLGPARVASTEVAHRTTRNSMSVLDTAWNGVNVRGASPGPAEAPMFWDNRTLSLEAQVFGPLRNVDEMRGTSFGETEIVPEIVRRLSEVPEYVALFEAAFGSPTVTELAIGQAIAAFERTLVARGSSFDRYMLGDESAMSPAQKRGLVELVTRGCTQCHSGPMFSDFRLHTMPAGHGPPHGGGAHTPGGVMRTPSLRNVTRTAPYFQDGSHATLDDVFTFYVHADRSADPDLAGIDPPMPIDPGARSDLKAFFGAISDAPYDTTIPARVPSGLHPGGAIP